jgi:hypothetical protein
MAINRKGKILMGLTILAVVSIVVLEYIKPKKVNWFPSYAMHHKIPFGTFVFQEQLERIFTKESIENVTIPPFEYLAKNDNVSGTYLFVNGQVSFGEAELNRLLEWTSQGNQLVVASGGFEETLLDTLGLEVDMISGFNNFNRKYKLQLKNHRLSSNIYNFDKGGFLSYFSSIDTLNTKVVGIIDNVIEDDSEFLNEHINVIRQKFGEGEILLSMLPQAFTNYFILNEPNNNYTAGLISYLDENQTIYVDQHYKSGKSFYLSPLYVLLNTKELKWAYYLFLIGVFLYVIFEGKRKQRAIPIVKPMRNQTIDFTRTIANMYYEKGNHKEISEHKIKHFLEHIRMQFHLQTEFLDENFVKQLSARSNNKIGDVKALFRQIDTIQNQRNISQQQLEALNASIDKFKSKNTWKTKN